MQGVTPWQYVMDQVYPDQVPHVPDVSHIRVLGCKVYILIEKEKRTTLEKVALRAELSILVGYEAYNIQRVYLPHRHGKKVICLLHVRFDEGNMVTNPFPEEIELPKI